MKLGSFKDEDAFKDMLVDKLGLDEKSKEYLAFTENYERGLAAIKGAYRDANSYGRDYEEYINDMNDKIKGTFGDEMALSAEQLTSLVNKLAEITISGGKAEYITTKIQNSFVSMQYTYTSL